MPAKENGLQAVQAAEDSESLYGLICRAAAKGDSKAMGLVVFGAPESLGQGGTHSIKGYPGRGGAVQAWNPGPCEGQEGWAERATKEDLS